MAWLHSSVVGTSVIETVVILMSTCSAIALGYLIHDFYQRLSNYRRIKQFVSARSGLTRRLLTALEVRFDVRQRVGDCLDVNAAFIRSVDEPIEEKLLLQALQRVADRHPMLRSKIVRFE